MKCVEICACISKGVAKFFHHISDTLDLRQESLLHTGYLFVVKLCVLLVHGLFVVILI